MNGKSMKILSFALSLAMVFGFCANNFYADAWEERGTNNGSVIGLIVSLVVGVTVASALLPTVFNQTADLEEDTAGDLDTDEEALIGVWNILIIVGVMLAIIGVVV